MPSGLTIKEWNGEKVKQLLHKKLDSKMVASGVLMVNDTKEHLNHEGAAKAGSKFVGTGTIGVAGKVYGKGRLIYNKTASDPGEDPFKQHRDLFNSITYTYDSATKNLRVGTTLLYGKFLELGTKKMAARPFLRNEWKRAKQKIQSLFSGS
jgi:HK97 gp10 family phage protein